jgi:hypothetical protein
VGFPAYGWCSGRQRAPRSAAGVVGDLVDEAFWRPHNGVNRPLSQPGPGIARVGAYYADDDGRQHAIVATIAGLITELSWRLS